MGNLIESHNLLSLAFNCLGIAVPRAGSLALLHRRALAKRLTSSICFSLSKPFLASNASFFRVQVEMTELEACYMLLRGLPLPAVEMIEGMIAAIQKERTALQRELLSGEDSGDGQLASERSMWIKELDELLARMEMLLSVALMATSDRLSVKQRVPNLFVKSCDACISETADDPVILICRGMHCAVEADFRTACDLFNAGGEAALSIGDKHLYYMALLGRGWYSLCMGNISDAAEMVEQVMLFASSAPQTCLHIWILELEIVLKTIGYDFDGAEATWEAIATMQRRDKFSPTTSALIAFSLAKDARFPHAADHALYACQRMSARQQGSPIAGVILFCGAYAGLDVLENATATGGVYGPSVITGDPAIRRLERTELGQAVSAAMRSLEGLSKRFPFLVVLYLTMVARVGRLYGDKKGAKALLEIDTKMKPLKLNYFQFVFGYSHFHLQRCLLCVHLGVPTTYMRHYDSRLLARKYFRRFGMMPTELIVNVPFRRPNSSSVRVDQVSPRTQQAQASRAALEMDDEEDDGDAPGASGSAPSPSPSPASSYGQKRDVALSHHYSQKLSSRPNLEEVVEDDEDEGEDGDYELQAAKEEYIKRTSKVIPADYSSDTKVGMKDSFDQEEEEKCVQGLKRSGGVTPEPATHANNGWVMGMV